MSLIYTLYKHVIITFIGTPITNSIVISIIIFISIIISIIISIVIINHHDGCSKTPHHPLYKRAQREEKTKTPFCPTAVRETRGGGGRGERG